MCVEAGKGCPFVLVVDLMSSSIIEFISFTALATGQHCVVTTT